MKITILGAGAYGIALAKTFEKNTKNITLWTNDDKEVEMLNKYKENKRLFPGIKINDSTIVTSKLNEALKDSKIIVIAIPTIAVRQTLINAKKYLNGSEIFVNASKGIEQTSLEFICTIIGNVLRTKKYANLSGPTIAIDLAKNEKCSLTLASKNNELSDLIKKYIETDSLKIEQTKDIIGTEICGSIKNCFALGSGLLEGLNVSISTKSRYLTQCMNDLKNISYLLGGNKNTINTYAGIGDLIMTCSSTSSRNFHYGYLIGSNATKDKIAQFKNTKTIEGLYTLKSIKKLLDKKGISISMINILYDIFYNGLNPKIILK